MSRGAYRAWRSFAAALALLGVLLHATLVPWHAGARAAARSAPSDLLSDLTVICHSGTAGAVDVRVNLPDGSGQSDRRQDCLVCKGLAAATLAVLAVPCPVPVPTDQRVIDVKPADRVTIELVALQPRSRGPPQGV